MPYNYSALLGKIVEKYGTQARFSDAIGISEHSISQKLNGKTEWKQSEMDLACRLMGISKDDIPKYFFTVKVQSS